MYLLGVAIFLVGSVMSGAATSMFTLIVARGIQGLGAGAIIPMSMTIVGELYTLAERARTQALFSGVWGVASIAGPLVGGYITDALSWRWVFYLNVPFGLFCMAVIALAYPKARLTRQVQVDWLGAGLLFSGISTLLIAIGGDAGSTAGWLAATIVLLGGFVVAERRAVEPILPLSLLRLPVISRTIVVVFLVGIAMFGAIAFIPLFVQSVQGGTATQAGQVLTPLFLGWVVMSIVGARVTVRIGYRVSAVAGSILMTAGFLGLSLLDSHSPRSLLLTSCTILGAGEQGWARRCCPCCLPCNMLSIDLNSASPRRSINSHEASALPWVYRPWAPSSRAALQERAYRAARKRRWHLAPSRCPGPSGISSPLHSIACSSPALWSRAQGCWPRCSFHRCSSLTECLRRLASS
jgi:MFS family permease